MKLRMFGRLRMETRKRIALVPMQRRETPMKAAEEALALSLRETESAEMAKAQDTKLSPCKLLGIFCVLPTVNTEIW